MTPTPWIRRTFAFFPHLSDAIQDACNDDNLDGGLHPPTTEQAPPYHAANDCDSNTVAANDCDADMVDDADVADVADDADDADVADDADMVDTDDCDDDMVDDADMVATDDCDDDMVTAGDSEVVPTISESRSQPTNLALRPSIIRTQSLYRSRRLRRIGKPGDR